MNQEDISDTPKSESTQDVEEIQKHLAGRGKRLAAYFIDILPITLAVLALFYFFLGFDDVINAYLNRNGAIEPRAGFLEKRNLIREVVFFVWVGYCIVFDALPMQGTFGKKIMGIKVVDENRNGLTKNQSMRRNVGKILSFYVFFLGFAWIYIDKKRQGWHDKIAKTYVVDANFQKK